jgi:hypothetical protein
MPALSSLGFAYCALASVVTSVQANSTLMDTTRATDGRTMSLGMGWPDNPTLQSISESVRPRPLISGWGRTASLL